MDPYAVNSNMNSLIFTPAETVSFLKSLKTGKATGPGEIHNNILRELAKDLSIPFCSLFNQSIETVIFPKCWKVAHVGPIFKNGDRSLLQTIVPFPSCVLQQKLWKELSLNTYIIFSVIILL